MSPLTEIVLGALFVLGYLKIGLTWQLLFFLIALALLLALVLYDLAHQILPTELLYTFVGVSGVASYASALTHADFLHSLLVALGVGGSLAALHFFSRGRAMGFADAPLAFGLSLLTGATALTGFVFSFWIGAVIGVVLLLGRPKGSRMGVEVPFAPFLACGFLLAYFTQWNLFVYIIVSTLL
jgi:prepilin signal peptidase PulO-like enzyme (type II secretory pathway)